MLACRPHILIALAALAASVLLLPSCASSAGSGGGTAADAPSAGSVDLALLDETPIRADSATLYVEGLSCPACATNVDHQLMEIDGVKLVRVNLGDGLVDVSLGGGVRPSRATLARAIHDSGFTLTRIVVPQ